MLQKIFSSLLFNPVPNGKCFDWSKLTLSQMTDFQLFQIERVCRRQFKIGIGCKVSNRVENTEGKGEIAHYEQFLLSPQCFQKACFPEASKGVIVWEWVKSICRQHSKCYCKIEICFGTGRKHCRKRRKCCYPAFPPFPQCFQKLSF